MHVRAQIRQAVVAALKAANIVDQRVYPTRVYPIAELPAIGVWSLVETVVEDAGTFGAATIEFREVAIVVDAMERVAAEFYIDDKLDEMCEAIEPVMGADPTWGGLAHTTELQQSEFIFDAETEQPSGRARLTWRIVYRVDVSDPSVPLA